MLKSPPAVFANVSITWNSGWWASDLAGLSTSTSRSNGTSWWEYAARSAVRTRWSSSAKEGSPDTSVRSTRVLTKNPTRLSSASSVRPAIAVPMGMSAPAPIRVSRAAIPAWTTMNRLAWWALASAWSASWTTAGTSSSTTPPPFPATAGRGRSVGSSSSSGASASVARQ